MSVDNEIDRINQRRHDRAHEQGKVWCGRRAHEDREPGSNCPGCEKQEQLRQEFWKTMN